MAKSKTKIVPTIPQAVTLNGIKIVTEYNENLLSDRETFGEFCPRIFKIILAKNMNDQRTQLTYCHEVVEAIKSIYALELKETEIQAIGLAFYELLMQGKLCTVIEEEE